MAERARLNARQGVRYHPQAGMDVLDPQTMTPVPHDGSTMGEIMFRGNITMKGYLKNPKTSDEAFAGGWFHWQRPGCDQAGRLRQDRDPSKGHHHLRRRKHLQHRSRRTYCTAGSHGWQRWSPNPIPNGAKLRSPTSNCAPAPQPPSKHHQPLPPTSPASRCRKPSLLSENPENLDRQDSEV